MGLEKSLGDLKKGFMSYFNAQFDTEQIESMNITAKPLEDCNDALVFAFDDSKSFLNLFRLALDEQGYSGELHLFQRFYNFYPCLEKKARRIKDSDHAWVITDWVLNQPLTKEANIERLCQYFPDDQRRKIVVVTNYLSEEIKQACFQRGVFNVYQKPDDYVSLLRLIETVTSN